jgi:hypothetical protein
MTIQIPLAAFAHKLIDAYFCVFSLELIWLFLLDLEGGYFVGVVFCAFFVRDHGALS